MNRWIAQALVFGVAFSGVAASNNLKLSPGQLLLSSGAQTEEGGDVIDPSIVWFEFLNQCSGADLLLDTCLGSNTIAALIDLPLADDDDDYGDLPGRRFLEDDCSPPISNEEDVRGIVGVAKAQCIESGVPVPDQEFENAVESWLMALNADSCFQQMCNEELMNNSLQLFEIMFDAAAECAGVELDMPQCLRDEVFEMILNDEGSESDTLRRKLSRSLSHDASACDQPSKDELSLSMSILLSEAKLGCDGGVSPSQIDKANADLVEIFASWNRCWGVDEDCDMAGGEPHHDEQEMESPNDEMFNIAIEFVNQCAELDLNLDSCLASNMIEQFQASPSAPAGRRGLEEGPSDVDECLPPQLDEWTLRFMVESSKQLCSDHGLAISDQEFEETVDDFMALFGAQDCWAHLCDEDPPELLLEIMFEEIGQCAQANFDDLSPCLMDQIYALFSSSSDDDDGGTFDGVRRKLEDTFGGSEDMEDPCGDHSTDAELDFMVNLLLAGAQQQCAESGEVISSDEIARAHSEFFKLFRAQHCWGGSSDCDEHHDQYHSYQAFIRNGTTWELGQCAGVEEISCVFSRSIEMVHAMNHDNTCTAPSVDDIDVKEIALHAKEHCVESGAYVADHQHNQTVNDLEHLLTKPGCWEELCEEETKIMIAEDWMHTCASVDLKNHPLSSWSAENWTADLWGGYDWGDDGIDDDWIEGEDDSLGDDGIDDDWIDGEDDSLGEEMLRCMTDFIMPHMWQQSAHWACALSNVYCNFDVGKEAYAHCGGEIEAVPPPPTPAPSMLQLSMSFAYDEDSYDWAQYEPEMSLPIEDGFSMSYDDFYGDDGGPDETEMLMYIDEVCSLISDLNSDLVQQCLEPVCQDLWLEDSELEDLKDAGALSTVPPSPAPTATTRSPTVSPSLKDAGALSTVPPSPAPTRRPTSDSPTTAKPISLPPTLLSEKPTPVPTRLPTPSPTSLEVGEAEASVLVEMKLEGIDVSDIDVTALDKVVDLIQSVLRAMLPDDAIVRLLSVGGYSVARRLLRFLQDDGSVGVDVEFEIIMTQTCSSAACDGTESTEISNSIQSVTSDLKAKVESGELTDKIQEEAESAGVSEFANVSVSASTMQVSEPTVTVKEASPEGTDDDDDSASSSICTMLSLALVLLSTMVLG